MYIPNKEWDANLFTKLTPKYEAVIVQHELSVVGKNTLINKRHGQILDKPDQAQLATSGTRRTTPSPRMGMESAFRRRCETAATPVLSPLLLVKP